METKSNYPCSQSTLYPTNTLIIARLVEKREFFSDFRAGYNDAYCNGLIAENAAAENLPNEQMRALLHQSLRGELVARGKDCRNKWQRLKRYIEYAFPDNFEDCWMAAGWDL